MVECDWQPSLSVTIDARLAAGLLPLQDRRRRHRERQRLRAADRAGRHQPRRVHDYERGHHVAGLQHVGRALPLRRPRPGARERARPARGWCPSTAPMTDRPGERPISSATSSPSSSWPRASGWTSPIHRHRPARGQPSLLTNHKCLVSLGHDEYWSQVMRTAPTRPWTPVSTSPSWAPTPSTGTSAWRPPRSGPTATRSATRPTSWRKTRCGA